MTDPEPYDSTFDLGGLPGGDALFVDPTAPSPTSPTSPAEPAPTASVRPPGGTAYRPDPPIAYTPPPEPAVSPRTPATPPVPPASWPRADQPRRGSTGPSPATGPAPHGATRPRPTSGRPRPRPARRRTARGAWPLVALLFWAVPAGIHAIRGDGSTSGSGSSSTSANPFPDQVEVNHPGMTVLKPHSLHADSENVTIHVDAPTTGDLTITIDGYPQATDVTTVRDYEVHSPTTSTDTLIVSSDSTLAIRCEIRDGAGAVVAVGEGLGILDCVYDPDELLE